MWHPQLGCSNCTEAPTGTPGPWWDLHAPSTPWSQESGSEASQRCKLRGAAGQTGPQATFGTTLQIPGNDLAWVGGRAESRELWAGPGRARRGRGRPQARVRALCTPHLRSTPGELQGFCVLLLGLRFFSIYLSTLSVAFSSLILPQFYQRDVPQAPIHSHAFA